MDIKILKRYCSEFYKTPTYLPYIGSPFSVCIWVVVWNATPLLSVRYLRFIVFFDESNDDKEEDDEDENWFLPFR
jgi:hypothetical protein